MLPNSNNGTNGRNSAHSMSISQDHKQIHGLVHQNHDAALVLPEKNPIVNASTSLTKTTNIDNSRSNNNTGTKLTVHCQDKPTILSNEQTKQPQCHTQEQQTYKKDERHFSYLKPQMNLKRLEFSDSFVLDVNETHTFCNAQNNHEKLVYCNGDLVSGSLEALITHVVPTCDYYPEHNYVFSFLLSARLFIRPHELLAQISQTWGQQQQEYSVASTDIVDEANFSHLSVTSTSISPMAQRKCASNETHNFIASTTTIPDANKFQRTPTQKSAQNCIHLLSEWIETFPYDFRDERLMQQVRILARKCVYIDNLLGKLVSRILQLLVQRLTALEKYEEFLQSLAAAELNSSYHQNCSTSAAAPYGINPSAVPTYSNTEVYKPTFNEKTNANISIPTEITHAHEIYGIMDICTSCAQLAHQLTAIELERLSYIGPEEFVQAFAKEYQHSFSNISVSSGASKTCIGGNITTNSLNDMKKTRNLESYVEWFNRLSYLTATEIVKYPKKKQRVRIIEYWIETARECFNIGNFNSLMAIIAGLNLAPISRLKKTWSKVQSAKFSVLEHQMDPTSNFISYRSTLKAAMWRSEGATDERERIIIPFFSLFVKDLYFLNEGCSNRLQNNHINFEKCAQLAKQVMEFNEWKKVICPFEKLPHVISYLQNSPVLNENTLCMASFECEPPENTEEKGRYKTVKAETKQQLLQQLQEQHQHQQTQ